MSLKEYSRKRRFEKTPEPPPQQAPAGGRRFFVQRHDARRLHYDLRLEMEGVLRSWAVPKGPTLDPEIKRLAVLVEDHPLDYGSFEGTIPAGNYGAGRVTLWDRGHYEVLGDKKLAEQMERGDFKFKLHGEKLVGEFALVRMKNRGKGNEWLLLKKKDFAARPGWDAEDDLRSLAAPPEPSAVAGAVKAAMPGKLTPMLATLATTLPEGPEWAYEVKWDGVRALCFLEDKNKKMRLVSRNGLEMERQYPELAALRDLVAAKDAILDGEIVALDEKGRPSFALLQRRITRGSQASAQLARSRPVTFFAFDLPYCGGYDLRGASLEDRKRMLASIVTAGPLLRVSEHFPGQGAGKKMLDFAREHGLEGIVAKRLASRYESKRSTEWMKIKVVTQQEFVIGGLAAGERAHFASLVLGLYDGKGLAYVGNAGSGFDEESLERVHKLLKPLFTARSPFAGTVDFGRKLEIQWVKPETVCTVKFASWTPDRRLRAPVFLGIRQDVAPRECVVEAETPAAPAKNGKRKRGPLLPEKKTEVILQIEGRQLKFTNLNKVFYPQEGVLKRDVINYYEAVAELLLPHLKDRPLSLKRYPNGIEGKYFFQKDAAESFPEWLRTEPVFSEHNQAPIHFVVADDRASLLYLANLACIDQNPWMSRVGTLDNPDFVLVDLDPSGCEYDRIVEAAQLVRRKLDALKMEGCPKTTGGDGMHIYIPIAPRYSYAQARSFAEILARLVAMERPDLFTTPRTVTKREKGKVYFDYLQISTGKTISAPYVLRAYAGAPVSTPLEWREVSKGLRPRQFHIGNALDRFERMGDIFAPVLTKRQKLEPALEKLAGMVAEAKS